MPSRAAEGAVLAVACALAAPAQARSGGIAAMGCDGCHGGGQPAHVTLEASPMNAAVGEPITLTISVDQTNGASAGFYLTTAFDSPGHFQAIEAGTGVDASGVMHTTPRAGSQGRSTFKTQWTADVATGVIFDVYALSANGDRTNRGDGAGVARLALAIGCPGQTYYIDQDDDGYGSADPIFVPRVECEQPPGYAMRANDCDDFRADVHPSAPELCDLRDNDCDGVADDDIVVGTYCEDRDGDGHGVLGRTTNTDCKPTPGFGACDGDCDDGDARVYPGASETCDLRDNDCDGEADEDVRPTCGLGLCARRARDCTLATCTPGSPVAETCNGYDDDCDGIKDNGIGICQAGTNTGGSSSETGGRSNTSSPAGVGAGPAPSSVSRNGCSVGNGSETTASLSAALMLGLAYLRGRARRRMQRR